MSISLMAGLGNPGPGYSGTRHNIGFAIIDAFARRHGCEWKKRSAFQAETAVLDRSPAPVLLVKPLTYVNKSGVALGSICRYYRIPTRAVAAIFDEMNLPLGRVKISVRGSEGGHNGVASLLQHLGNGFVRYRVGIGPRHPTGKALKDFVLGKFAPWEKEKIEERFETFLDGLELLLDCGPAQAMNQINQKTNHHESNQV